MRDILLYHRRNTANFIHNKQIFIIPTSALMLNRYQKQLFHT